MKGIAKFNNQVYARLYFVVNSILLIYNIVEDDEEIFIAFLGYLQY